jgi:cobalt-zinc-cadmium efflux system membrane fusion protein
MLLTLQLVSLCTGCGKQAPAPAAAREEEKESTEPLTKEQIFTARCSHGKTIECAECRYEVGVVKVKPELIKKESATNGIVCLQAVARKPLALALDFTGEIRLNENATVHLSPRIAGVIHSVTVDLGAQVKAGDLLFVLQRAEVGAARGDYEKCRALTELARKNFEREEALHRQKIGSEADMIEARMKLEENQAAQKAAAQKLRVLGLPETEWAAGAEQAGLLAVRAPLAGVLLEKHAVKGEIVDPNRDIMLLASLDTLWVWGNVFERDFAPWLQQAERARLPVEIFVRAFPDRKFRGTLDYVSATMDEATRTAKVRVTIENAERLLRPGMFCEVRLTQPAAEPALAVPKGAVLTDEGADFVFVHLQDDYFVRQPVTRGRENADEVEIVKGLEAGQTIVAEGAFLLKSDVLRAKMGAGCAD